MWMSSRGVMCHVRPPDLNDFRTEEDFWFLKLSYIENIMALPTFMLSTLESFESQNLQLEEFWNHKILQSG